MSKVYQELGNPLAGCFPLLLQMPVLFALFATLRGSPFADINYTVDLQIFPQAKLEQIQPQAYATKPQNIYIADGVHASVAALLPGGNRLVEGEEAQIKLESVDGKPFSTLLNEYTDSDFQINWTVTQGENLVNIDNQGHIVALAPGDVKLQGKVKGIAADKGFLFIDALGRVGAMDEDGIIHWDIVGMILGFGISLYVNQVLSGQGQGSSGNPQQDTINKITPVLFSGMFFFFPLPAGVLLYMLIANIFQTGQAFILSREPLPENLQKLVEESEVQTKKSAKGDKDGKNSKGGREALPFEPGGRSKKKV